MMVDYRQANQVFQGEMMVRGKSWFSEGDYGEGGYGEGDYGEGGYGVGEIMVREMMVSRAKHTDPPCNHNHNTYYTTTYIHTQYTTKYIHT